MRVRVYVNGEQGRPHIKSWDWGKSKWVTYARSRFVKLHNAYFYGGKHPYILGDLEEIVDWPGYTELSYSQVSGRDIHGDNHKVYNKVLDSSLVLDTNGFYFLTGQNYTKATFAKRVIVDNGIVSAAN